MKTNELIENIQIMKKPAIHTLMRKPAFFALPQGKKLSLFRLPRRRKLSLFRLPRKEIIRTVLLPIILSLIILLTLTGCEDKAPPNTVESLEDIHGRTIGALSGSPSARLVDDMGTVRLFADGEEMISSLLAGTVDCLVAESTFAEEIALDASGVRILNETLLEYDISYAVARENKTLLAAVNNALTELERNGTLEGLRDKYYMGERYEYVPPENITKHPGSLILAIAPDTPPNSYIGADGEYEGIDIDISRALCDYLGVELIIEEFQAGELITAVRYGKADLALDWLPGDGEDLVNLSNSYAQISQSVIVRR